MRKQYGFTLFEMLFALGVIFSAVGWIANIVRLVGMELTPITMEIVLRLLGIPVAPLGAVMGYL